MDLSDLPGASSTQKNRKRVGRGNGSGHGKTSCRGHKGQGARSGGGTRPGFEGGQMPLQRRIPKRGFHSPFKKRYALINVGQLESLSGSGEISPELLLGRGLMRSQDDGVKILGNGNISKALTVKAHGFSSKAKEKIEAAGGRVEALPHA
ncbi:MAG: 50S ribosomal protein L15 [Deltaproteobacteria bacterium]|nr:50S ribosomal protein L15 [Deltaproteobacteria bacterium]